MARFFLCVFLGYVLCVFAAPLEQEERSSRFQKAEQVLRTKCVLEHLFLCLSPKEACALASLNKAIRQTAYNVVDGLRERSWPLRALGTPNDMFRLFPGMLAKTYTRDNFLYRLQAIHPSCLYLLHSDIRHICTVIDIQEFAQRVCDANIFVKGDVEDMFSFQADRVKHLSMTKSLRDLSRYQDSVESILLYSRRERFQIEKNFLCDFLNTATHLRAVTIEPYEFLSAEEMGRILYALSTNRQSPLSIVLITTSFPHITMFLSHKKDLEKLVFTKEGGPYCHRVTPPVVEDFCHQLLSCGVLSSLHMRSNFSFDPDCWHALGKGLAAHTSLEKITIDILTEACVRPFLQPFLHVSRHKEVTIHFLATEARNTLQEYLEEHHLPPSKLSAIGRTVFFDPK